MKKMLSIATVFTCTVVAFGRVAVADSRYEFVKGKDIRVCEAYKKNLDSTLGYPSCNRKLVLPEFSRPQWRRLDGLANIEFVRRIDDFLNGGRKPINERPYMEHLKGRLEDRSIELDIANVDIDNDGVPDKIIKYKVGRCLQRFFAEPLVVVSSGEKKVDVKKTELLLQNRAKTKDHAPGRWGYAMYEVFRYEEQSYFDRWSDDLKEKGYLRVFRAEGNQVNEICVYKYR